MQVSVIIGGFVSYSDLFDKYSSCTNPLFRSSSTMALETDPPMGDDQVLGQVNTAGLYPTVKEKISFPSFCSVKNE